MIKVNRITVADILSGGIDKYLLSHKLSYKQTKVVNKIIHCFSDNTKLVNIKCSNEKCDYQEIKNKPCRDRHCNKCCYNKQIKWLINLLQKYVPLPFYHVVFTLPSELNNLSICNQKLIYDIFFKSSFYVLNKFAKDPKHFGGKIGYIGLLHTWGSKLLYHPHIHFMVLAGGIKGNKFCKFPYGKKFMFPVKALSPVMMGKFIELLKEKYAEGKLLFPGKLEGLSSPKEFNKLLYKLSKKKWVIYSKTPFANGDRTLEYISRYVHRVAIANSRIKSYVKGMVRFEYKYYVKKGKREVQKKDILPLKEEEFIRRFLLHILPERFRKIRYGGIFSPNQKNEAIRIIMKTIGLELSNIIEKVKDKLSELEKSILCLCPKCESKVVINEYG